MFAKIGWAYDLKTMPDVSIERQMQRQIGQIGREHNAKTTNNEKQLLEMRWNGESDPGQTEKEREMGVPMPNLNCWIHSFIHFALNDEKPEIWRLAKD